MEPVGAIAALVTALVGLGVMIWQARRASARKREDTDLDHAMAQDDLRDLSSVQHDLNDRLRRKDGGAGGV